MSDRVRAELLYQWRLAQNLDVTVVARKANLSVAQIQQLESQGSSLFYSPAIKEAAARKVALLLGGDPVLVIDDAIVTAEETWAHPSSLSNKGPSLRTLSSPFRRLGFARWSRPMHWAWGALLLMCAVAWGLGRQHPSASWARPELAKSPSPLQESEPEDHQVALSWSAVTSTVAFKPPEEVLIERRVPPQPASVALKAFTPNGFPDPSTARSAADMGTEEPATGFEASDTAAIKNDKDVRP
jgi:transcriptional regulator with XRE-family HTH domain